MLADSFEQLPFGYANSSDPKWFQQAGDHLLFSTDDGYQVWSTDGSAEGTGPVPGLPNYAFPVGEVNGRALYSAGNWMWATDGTDGGTTPLSFGANATEIGGASLGDRFVVGGGAELTFTDGFSALDAASVPAAFTQDFTTAGGYVYFTCKSDQWSGPDTLWRTQGTSASTEQVIFPEGVAFPRSLTAVGNDLYVVMNGAGLWKVGRFAPTPTRVANLPDNSCELAAVDDSLLLWQRGTADLYRLNGAALELIADFDDGRIFTSDIGLPKTPAVHRGDLYFTARRAGTDANLWKTDGSIAGTKPLATVPTSGSWFLDIVGSQKLQPGLALLLDQGSQYALWMSNGDASNTRELVQHAGYTFGQLGERVYFSATDAAGAELWTYDGTQAVPTRLVDLAPGVRGDLWNSRPIAWGERVLFADAPGYQGTVVLDPRTDRIHELSPVEGHFVNDPVPDRAFSVATSSDLSDIWMLRADTLQREHVATRPEYVLYTASVGPRLIFAQEDGYWSTDGTPAGTQRFFAGSNPEPRLFDTGELAYFALGNEVYQTEGTAASTHRVAVVSAGERVSTLSRRADGSLFLLSSDNEPDRTYRLWIAQPSSQDASLLQTWTDVGFPEIEVLGSTGLFAVGRANRGELWTSDGTQVGTRMVSNVFTAPVSWMAHVGTKAFLITQEREVWVADLGGTPTRLPLTVPSPWSDYSSSVLDGKLYFTAHDGEKSALWRTDGTEAGTERLSELSFYESTTVIGQAVYVTTVDEGGALLWRYTPGYASPRLGEQPVTLRGGGISYIVPTGSGEQLRSVPMASISEVSLRFDEEVIVKQSDLTIRGERSGAVGVAGFSFDPNTNSATWTLAEPIQSADRFTLTLDDAVHDPNGTRLDGEWTNPTHLDERTNIFRSGDLIEGGDFVFYFSIAPGDANRDNQVSSADFQIWSDRFGAVTQGGIPAADFNADGIVSGIDFSIWAEFFGSFIPTDAAPAAGVPQPLPPTSPLAPRHAPSTSDAHALGAVDWVLSQSFRETLDNTSGLPTRRRPIADSSVDRKPTRWPSDLE